MAKTAEENNKNTIIELRIQIEKEKNEIEKYIKLAAKD
jgi:hypothetical protein